MRESPYKAFQGGSASIPDDSVFPELGEPTEGEATQLQDTAARFEVFYAKMQVILHGISLLTNHLWRIYDLVWFHAPLRIYQRGSHLIKTVTQSGLHPVFQC